ncbi:MAG: hypothetical protein J6U29_02800 [Bacteroidales bacterium]|nr:hypothetical protein [Bacteroidales bacterium]
MNALVAILSEKGIDATSLSSKISLALASLAHRGKEIQLIEKEVVNMHVKMGIGYFDFLDKYSYEDEKVVVHFAGKILFEEKIRQKIGENFSERVAQNVAILYETIGTECFSFLQGSWTLTLLDKCSNKLLAARDQFGNRPLFYYTENNMLMIASQAKAVYSSFEGAKTLNENAIIEYLLYGDIAKHKQNFYANIHSLPPAHVLEYDIENRHLSINPYYILPYKNCTAPYNPYEEPYFADTLRTKLIESVKGNFCKQESVAMGLSGGLDSSSIVYVARKFCPDTKITAFTAVNSYDDKEIGWAKKVAEELQIEWVKVPCTEEHIKNELPQAIQSQDIPIFSLSTFAQWKIMQTIGEYGCKMVVDGQGSDEMLAGYAAFYPPFMRFLRHEWIVKDYLSEILHLKNSPMSPKTLALMSLKDFAKKHYYRQEERLAKKVNEIACQAIDGQALANYFAREQQEEPYKRVLNDYLYASYTQDLPQILHWGEYSAAQFGIDYMTPFSDCVDLVEYVFQIPSTQKIHQQWNKYMLRKAMVGLVNEEILWRSEKLGFYIPEQKWYEQLNAIMKVYVGDQIKDEQLIDLQQIIDVWDKKFSLGDIRFQRLAFRLYSYLLWKNGLKEKKML